MPIPYAVYLSSHAHSLRSLPILSCPFPMHSLMPWSIPMLSSACKKKKKLKNWTWHYLFHFCSFFKRATSKGVYNSIKQQWQPLGPGMWLPWNEVKCRCGYNSQGITDQGKSLWHIQEGRCMRLIRLKARVHSLLAVIPNILCCMIRAQIISILAFLMIATFQIMLLKDLYMWWSVLCNSCMH